MNVIYDSSSILLSPAQALINPVNCSGTSGKGIPALFKRFYPLMFIEYQQLHKQGKLTPGSVHWHYIGPAGRCILLWAIQNDWKSPVLNAALTIGLTHILKVQKQFHLSSIAFPKIESLKAGLTWDDHIKPLILNALEPTDLQVHLCENG
jgi:O-acetyl-ADP-ribose deacetylase (regulator of RNase III)